MTGAGRLEASVEELERAGEELRAAESLLGLDLPRIALTRIYFAVFHALRALLYADGLEPRSHHGVQHLFNLHHVRPGRFPASAARLASRLQKYREEADYAESFVPDAEGAREDMEEASAFVAEVRARLSTR